MDGERKIVRKRLPCRHTPTLPSFADASAFLFRAASSLLFIGFIRLKQALCHVRNAGAKDRNSRGGFAADGEGTGLARAIMTQTPVTDAPWFCLLEPAKLAETGVKGRQGLGILRACATIAP
jgi:hypothetical protein